MRIIVIMLSLATFARNALITLVILFDIPAQGGVVPPVPRRASPSNRACVQSLFRARIWNIGS